MNYAHLSSPHTNGKLDKAMRYVSLGVKEQERATLRILIRGLHFSLILAGDSKVVQLEMICNLLAMEIPASQYTLTLTFQLYAPSTSQ